jgi:hypothetical protein
MMDDADRTTIRRTTLTEAGRRTFLAAFARCPASTTPPSPPRPRRGAHVDPAAPRGRAGMNDDAAHDQAAAPRTGRPCRLMTEPGLADRYLAAYALTSSIGIASGRSASRVRA